MRDLKGAQQPLVEQIVRRQAGDVLSAHRDAPGSRFKTPGNHIEKRGFSGPVRAYQRMYGACPDVDADVTDGGKAFEILGQVPGFKDG